MEETELLGGEQAVVEAAEFEKDLLLCQQRLVLNESARNVPQGKSGN